MSASPGQPEPAPRAPASSREAPAKPARSRAIPRDPAGQLGPAPASLSQPRELPRAPARSRAIPRASSAQPGPASASPGQPRAFPRGGDPYLIEGPAVVNFSGGRSSGYLLRRILDAHEGSLPSNVVVCFTNTGKERPETLDFIRDCQERWAVPIHWLEYRHRPWAAGGKRDPQNTWEEVDHASASRDGRPFYELINRKRFLPNPVMRICTDALKIQTTARFIRARYRWRRWSKVLGIRHDERRRWGRILMTDCDALLPLVEAEADQQEVQAFWQRAPFDLGIDSGLGNCDLCFLKSREALVSAIRAEPHLADWWIEQEQRVLGMRDTPSGRADATFRRGVRFADLLEAAQRPPDPTLFDGAEPGDWAECHCTD